MISSQVGQKMGPSNRAQEEASERLITQITAAVEAGNKNLLKKLGMGSYGVLYGSQEKRAMELFDPDDVTRITSLWSQFKHRFVESKDHANLFFHLYGVLFFMVPHVHSGEGRVKISLCSSNDPISPVIQEKSLSLADGAQAVLMSPSITLPFLKRGPMFYYTLECENTRAQIPCSVVAIWKQKIDTRSAVYSQQETMSWAIEALNRPQFFQDRQEAAQYIASVYSSGQSSQMALENRAFVGERLGNTRMDVLSESSMTRSSSLRIPTLKVQSRRFPSMELPDVPNTSRLTMREETAHDEDTGGLFPVKKAQGFNMGVIWDNLGIDSFTHIDFPDDWTERTIAQQVQYILFDEASRGNVIVPKHVSKREQHNIYKEHITEDNYVDILAAYGITKVGNLSRSLDWYDMSLHERVIALVHQRDHQVYIMGDFTNPLPSFDCYDGLTIGERKLAEIKANFARQLSLESKKETAPKLAQVAGAGIAESKPSESVGDSFVSTTSMKDNGEESPITITAEHIEDDTTPGDVIFDFGSDMDSNPAIDLEMQQPVCVASNEFFNVGVFEFVWEKSKNVAEQVMSLALPAALFAKKKETSMGAQMLKYYDAALIMYKVILYVSGVGAISGQLALVWDECNVLNRKKEFINIATLYASKHTLVSASQQQSEEFCFTPTGIGKYVPLDEGTGATDLGSIRVFVTHPLSSATELSNVPCHIHLQCKVLSTNILQPPRLIAQSQFGMKPGQTYFPRFPTNQVLLHYNWGTAAAMGTTLVSIFSPSGIYESDGVLQPSLLGNVARNCKWWTGTCVFEICIEKTLFHSGSLAIGLGTLNTKMSNAHDIFNMPHVVCNLEMGRKFRFKCTVTNWNGKNLLSTGRKSSLPRPGHFSHLRLFATVMKPLVSTSVHLDSVGVTVQLKCLENLVLGGTVSVKPIYGHWTKGKSAVDFLFSEMDMTQRKEIEKLRKDNVEQYDAKGKQPVKQSQVNLSIREKFSYGAVQYFCMGWKDEERLLVIPCAPWSVRFEAQSAVKEAITCPFIDWCTSFCYWSGSLNYSIVVHRVQSSPNVGGILNVALDSSGYPFPAGLSKGNYVVSAGGGSKWNFSYGVTTNIFSFTVQDDEFFCRRHTRMREFSKTQSRIMSLQDRLGNLIINLPPVGLVSSIEILISPGPDFKLEVAQPPSANHEKFLGNMQTHTYQYTSDFSELRDFEV
ncbi:polyprotein [Tomato chocolate spot virus]|uniref:polyprotein n=1 Tax=Tomato chocolate spot virus TaxID=661101 RepID=UPI0001B0841A|nr:polyprotein [Tomato chocolate spot virus]ACT79984.1 polyprotein [Tomato chocolate spot virus]